MERNQSKTEIDKQIHAGRRNKLKERFIRDGLDTFNECEVVEFAMGFCIPRIDTNPAAHRLINKYGSLMAIVDANPVDLENIQGIGKNTSIFLSFLKEFTIYLAKQKVKQSKVNTPQDALEYLRPLMKMYSVEQLVVLCIDMAGNVKMIETFTNNELDMVHLNIRELVTMVTSIKTARVILSHNHLNGDPSPSVPDMSLTRKLLATFTNLQIEFADHIIFADDKHFSFATSGTLEKLKKESTHI